MGSLFIVRHAQASFLADDYDQLSALGQVQSQLLGAYWAARKMRFDRVYSGPRVRQRETAKLVGDAYGHAGGEFPEVQIVPEFDEYPADLIMRRGLPLLLETDQRARDLNANFLSCMEEQDRHLSFQRLFEYMLAKWVREELRLEGVESWLNFRLRVNSGLDLLLSQSGHGERIVIFTSAGPTAVALQRALLFDTEQTLQMSWMPRNSSWSEFLYNKNKFTLSSFNAYGHLVDDSHLTYR